MVFQKNNQNGMQRGRVFKKSMLAMCVMAIGAPSLAQDEAVEEIVVTGARANLQSAQEIKKNATTFVDSISAEDIGALPDRSVLEAMSRIPGISIERFAGKDDPDHFSTEGSGVVIRGMTATRSEFNGRDSFTANSGRGLSFQDVPPELMGGVDVYKNQSADLIEGGIGGTVSLRTRKPFDSPDRVLAFNADYSVGDMTNEWTPTVSGLFSDQWDTSAGTFGALLNLARSEGASTSNGIQSDAYLQYEAQDHFVLDKNGNQTFTAAGTAIRTNNYDQYKADPKDITTFGVLPGAERFARYNPDGSVNGMGQGVVWMPNGSNLSMKQDDRQRKGYAAAAQWKSPDETLTGTFQFMRSDALLAWTENTIGYQGGYANVNNANRALTQQYRETRPIAGYPGYTFDNKGLFQAGSLADQRNWRTDGANNDHQPKPVPYTTVAPKLDESLQFGHRFLTSTRYKETETVVDDYALNFKWTPTDNWEFEADAQHIEAETRDDDVTIFLGVNTLQNYDTRGHTPHVSFIEPWNGRRDASRAAAKANGGVSGYDLTPDDPLTLTKDETNTNPFPGFSNDPAGDTNYFQDPNSYWWRAAMDHYERSAGDSDAFAFNTNYKFDDDVTLIRGVKAGVRYAKRQQIVRLTSWNWGGLGPEFGGRAQWLPELTGQPAKQDECDPALVTNCPIYNQDLELVDWSNFHRGGGVAEIPGNKIIHPTADLVRAVMFQKRNLAITHGSWVPYEKKPAAIEVGDGGPFGKADIFDTTEINQAAYVRVDFGMDDSALPWSGNIGLRFVELERTALGSVKYPDFKPKPTSATDKRVYTPPAPLASHDLKWADVETYVRAEMAADTTGAYLPMNLPIDPIADPLVDLKINEKNWVLNLKKYSTASVNPQNDWINQSYNFAPLGDQQFGNNAFVVQDKTTNYTATLPSLNIKVELTDDLLARFAAAKAIAYPDMGFVKNQTGIGGALNAVYQDPNAVAPLPTDPPIDPDTVPAHIWTAFADDYTGSGGNPGLLPMESTQFDLSLEWYFAKVGSLTGTVFRKNLNNFFVKGAVAQTFTNPETGVTRTALIDGQRNGGEGTMDGFEIAYQQFYDMLPSPFDGLGIQANYTLINAHGVPNNQDEAATAEFVGGDNDTGARVATAGLSLEGQSKHTANFVLMYEKYDWAVRFAYNFRSRYLQTTRDVISKYPLWNDDAGYLDASAFYTINDNFTVGVQFTNLLDTQAKTIMILDGKGLEAGRSWFVSDRRTALTLKGTF
jgi:iron complex outermembrane recepter protein